MAEHTFSVADLRAAGFKEEQIDRLVGDRAIKALATECTFTDETVDSALVVLTGYGDRDRSWQPRLCAALIVYYADHPGQRFDVIAWLRDYRQTRINRKLRTLNGE